MTTAWIITREGTRHVPEVVAIVSARKSAKQIKSYIEFLYLLLECSAERNLEAARYTNAEISYEAQFDTTNTNVPVSDLLRCGRNPFLVARRAKNVSLIDGKDSVQILKWKNPQRLDCDPNTGHIVKKHEGVACQAVVNLPLRY
jgi:hypothetical protein